MSLQPAKHMPDVLTVLSGATYVASAMDKAEQQLRIIALIVTIVAGALAIYQRLRKPKYPKATVPAYPDSDEI